MLGWQREMGERHWGEVRGETTELRERGCILNLTFMSLRPGCYFKEVKCIRKRKDLLNSERGHMTIRDRIIVGQK